MSEHEHYPLTMAHPGYVPAKSLPIPGTERKGPSGNVISQDYQGTPEKFPPVTVADADQQEYYEAQGYKVAGHSDPSAYAAAHASAPPPDYDPEQYPKWVAGVLVASREEEAALATPETAIAHHDDETGPTALEEQLKAAMALIAELQANHATAPKNKGGRPRKAPEAQPAA